MDEAQGVSITKGIRLDVDLKITNEDYPELAILLVKTADTPKGQSVPVIVLGENTGNVDTSPTIKVTLLNLVMEKLEEHDIFNFGFIKPNKKETLTGKFSHNLPVGEYFMEVKVLLDEKELRRERLVFRVTDEVIPPIVGSVEKEQNIFQKINSLITENKTIIIYALTPLVAALFIYYIYTKFEKLEEKVIKKAKTEKEKKVEKILKGTKKVMKATFSFIVGMLTILLLLYNSDIENRLYIAEVKEVGDTQGVQDYNAETDEYQTALNVIPQIEEKEYKIYKEPDMLSEVLLTVKEGYIIKAAGETTDWYKVVLEDGTFGWLHKSSVKSKTVQEQ